jgi:hypothetical protein
MPLAHTGMDLSTESLLALGLVAGGLCARGASAGYRARRARAG